MYVRCVWVGAHSYNLIVTKQTRITAALCVHGHRDTLQYVCGMCGIELNPDSSAYYTRCAFKVARPGTRALIAKNEEPIAGTRNQTLGLL